MDADLFLVVVISLFLSIVMCFTSIFLSLSLSFIRGEAFYEELYREGK